MQASQDWRELLGGIIQDPHERQRLAKTLGVNPITLTRWVNQEADPRPQSLHKLLHALPEYREVFLELFQEEGQDLSAVIADDLQGHELNTISAEFYARVLRTRATLPKSLCFSSLCDLILQQALKHLDPYRAGMAIIVVRCLPPLHGDKIRSLRESLGRGTPPWGNSLEQQAILLGAESIAGHAVTKGYIIVNQNLKESQSQFVGYRGEWEESAAAAPIALEGNIAGCLLVSSIRPGYFLPSRLALIQSYADLIALACESQDFYEPARIELGLLPPQEVQWVYLSRFRQRVVETMTQATRNRQPITVLQAEQFVWQQIEEELLHLSFFKKEE